MSHVVQLAGKSFGQLRVVERAASARGQATWLCECACGTRVTVRSADLRSGHSKSCGCSQSFRIRRGLCTNVTHNMSGTSIYGIWSGIVGRCTNPAHDKYATYGGRGITVCDAWQSFETFYEEFGRFRPSERHTVDRIENHDGYRLGNVRWAVQVVQQNNRRNNVRLTHEGETLTLAEWGRRIGISRKTIAQRITRGWSVQQALSLASDRQRRVIPYGTAKR